MTYYECFNTKLEEFLNDLLTAFPEFKDFKVLKHGINLAKTIDAKMPANVFLQHMTDEYEKNILSRDDAFFMNEDYAYVADMGVDLDIISKLKTLWGQLDDSNKESVWKYLQVLVLLSRKCRK